MAGKFLLLDEAAQRLGMSVDDFQRLVDRKKVFPLRDGSTLKFKVEDIERYAADAAADGEHSGLTIELDMDAPAAEEIALADSVAMPGLGEATPGAADSLAIDLDDSGLLAPAGAPVAASPPAALPGNDDLAATMLGTGEAIGLDALDLDLDAVVGLSSPSVAAGAAKSSALPRGQAGQAEDSGTLAIDLSDVSVGESVRGSGDLVIGSGFGAAVAGSGTNAGAALSDVLDSGLSLEDGDAAASGIDLGPLDEAGGEDDAGGMLAGEVFEMGTPGDDDESASVVMAEESSLGDSSFFGTDADGDSSELVGEFLSEEQAGVPSFEAGDWTGGAVVPDTTFSVWQICGLVCLTLLMLTGGFLMFDLIQTVGSRDELSLSGPLVSPLAGLFGWRQ